MSTLTPEQIAIRSTGIGSSEIAMLCGESPYGGPHSVWLSKMGLRDDEHSEPAWWGSQMEPIVAARWEHETGQKLVKGSGTYRDSRYPVAVASPDYLTEDGRIVECKCAFRTAASWSLDDDGAPTGYIMQGQWLCGVLGAPGFDLAVFLAPFATFRIYRFDFDAELFGAAYSIADRFWREHVLTRNPPPADDSEAARKALRAIHRPLAELADATADADARYRAKAEADSAFKTAEQAKALADNRLVEAIVKSGADGLRGESWIATWKENKRGVRSLRVKDLNETKGRAA